MKNLKFRAWDGERSKMYFGDLLRDRWYCEGGFLDVSMGGLEGLEIMLFTGLLDKNGKEIYEGDILRDNYYPLNCPKGFQYFHIGVIEYSGNVFGFKIKLDCGEILDENNINSYHKNHREPYNHPTLGIDKYLKKDYWAHKMEIIGNIYESPSLLEQKQIA